MRDGISTLYIKFDDQRVARIESDELATSLLTDHSGDGQINATDAWLAANQDQPSGPLLWSSVRRLLLETGPDGNTTFLHHDHLGSTTMATGVVDGEPSILGERVYYPMGQVREEVGYVDEYGFTGQEIDRSTGLLHFDWRYYDPAVGRWLSVDPLYATTTADNITSLGSSTTAYAYVNGNVTNLFDPTGLDPKKKVKKVVDNVKAAKRKIDATKATVKDKLVPKQIKKAKNKLDVKIKIVASDSNTKASRKAKSIAKNNRIANDYGALKSNYQKGQLAVKGLGFVAKKVVSHADGGVLLEKTVKVAAKGAEIMYNDHAVKKSVSKDQRRALRWSIASKVRNPFAKKTNPNSLLSKDSAGGYDTSVVDPYGPGPDKLQNYNFK